MHSTQLVLFMSVRAAGGKENDGVAEEASPDHFAQGTPLPDGLYSK